MTNIFIRVILFLSSYFPLTLIFFIILLNKSMVATTVGSCILAAGILSLVVLAWYIRRKIRTQTDFKQTVTEVHKRDGDVMGYIASYLVPFVTFPLDDVKQTFSLIVFILVLTIIYVNSNMIYINPMLNLVGFHLYEVGLERSTISHSLITRHPVIKGETLHYVHVGNSFLIGIR